MKCSTPECGGYAFRSAQSGRCPACSRRVYMRSRAKGIIGPLRGVKCSKPGCHKPASCKGLCEGCYSFARRHAPDAPPCSVPWCERPRFRLSDGMCSACSTAHRRGRLPCAECRDNFATIRDAAGDWLCQRCDRELSTPARANAPANDNANPITQEIAS